MLNVESRVAPEESGVYSPPCCESLSWFERSCCRLVGVIGVFAAMFVFCGALQSRVLVKELRHYPWRCSGVIFHHQSCQTRICILL